MGARWKEALPLDFLIWEKELLFMLPDFGERSTYKLRKRLCCLQPFSRKLDVLFSFQVQLILAMKLKGPRMQRQER